MSWIGFWVPVCAEESSVVKLKVKKTFFAFSKTTFVGAPLNLVKSTPRNPLDFTTFEICIFDHSNQLGGFLKKSSKNM